MIQREDFNKELAGGIRTYLTDINKTLKEADDVSYAIDTDEESISFYVEGKGEQNVCRISFDELDGLYEEVSSGEKEMDEAAMDTFVHLMRGYAYLNSEDVPKEYVE